MKAFEQVIGKVSNGITVEKIADILKENAEILTGDIESTDSKTVIVEISVKEIKGV